MVPKIPSCHYILLMQPSRLKFISNQFHILYTCKSNHCHPAITQQQLINIIINNVLCPLFQYLVQKVLVLCLYRYRNVNPISNSIIMPGEHRLSVFDLVFVGVSAASDKVSRLCGDRNIKSVVKICRLSHENERRKHTWTINVFRMLCFLCIKGSRSAVTYKQISFYVSTTFILTNNNWTTCFGQFLCPSSAVFHCTHSNGICHTGLLTAISGILLASCTTYTIAVCTVKN